MQLMVLYQNHTLTHIQPKS